LTLRIKDVDFELNEIIVRDGKGYNDRRTLLPVSLIEPLKLQIQKAILKFQGNLSIKNFYGISVPQAPGRKYPNIPKEVSWQYVSPARINKQINDLYC